MNKCNKVSIGLIISHVVIVFLLTIWSYCDSNNLAFGRYFKLNYTFNLPRVLGNHIEGAIYVYTILLYPLIALGLLLSPKLKIKNKGKKLILHLVLSLFQASALVPLLS